MPPVLHVALDELPAGREHEVLAQEIGATERQRHDVLDLVAEANGPPGLIETRSSPQARADRLVEQPAVHHEIERVIRSTDLDGTEGVVPERIDLRPRRLRA